MSTKKRILICGATGFIGRNLVEQLSRDSSYEITGVYHKRPPYSCPGVKMIQADLTDKKEVSGLLKNVDVLIQAAATTSGAADIVNRPYFHVTDNAVMNSLLFREAFENSLKHVIFFSCTVMYSSGPNAQKEEDFTSGSDIYPRYFGVAWTKVYLEKVCEFFSKIGTTKYTVLRHSNIYGPHDKFDLERSHVFGASMAKVFSSRDKVTIWGAGEESRDLLYVDDLVEIVRLAIEKQTSSYELLNAGSGTLVSVKDLVAQIIRASGKQLAIEHDLSKTSLSTNVYLNCDKAHRLLGWRPQYTLEQGIKKTMRWLAESKNEEQYDKSNG